MQRAVKRSKKDIDGDILGLCNPGEYWSPRSKADVINDIETGAIGYYVSWTDGSLTTIRVVNSIYGKYLRTDKDSTDRNNLNDLPDC